MPIPYYHVDAFSASAFGGNPAGVCVLDAFLADEHLQAIAAEHNLSETAFIVRRGDDACEWDLRWCTPAIEVNLCGHATLASACVVLRELEPTAAEAGFHTRSGRLAVRRAAGSGGAFEMELPVDVPRPARAPDGLREALGVGDDAEVRATREGYLVQVDGEQTVRGLTPDFRALGAIEAETVIVTAAGDDDDLDFVSRVFAPAAGIDEDPVTGSAHTALTPHWAERLGRATMRAHQASRRGGDLVCTLAGARVVVEGDAVLYARGEIVIPLDAPVARV